VSFVPLCEPLLADLATFIGARLAKAPREKHGAQSEVCRNPDLYSLSLCPKRECSLLPPEALRQIAAKDAPPTPRPLTQRSEAGSQNRGHAPTGTEWLPFRFMSPWSKRSSPSASPRWSVPARYSFGFASTSGGGCVAPTATNRHPPARPRNQARACGRPNTIDADKKEARG
jgi:hypothetical protein